MVTTPKNIPINTKRPHDDSDSNSGSESESEDEDEDGTERSTYFQNFQYLIYEYIPVAFHCHTIKSLKKIFPDEMSEIKGLFV